MYLPFRCALSEGGQADQLADEHMFFFCATSLWGTFSALYIAAPVAIETHSQFFRFVGTSHIELEQIRSVSNNTDTSPCTRPVNTQLAINSAVNWASLSPDILGMYTSIDIR